MPLKFAISPVCAIFLLTSQFAFALHEFEHLGIDQDQEVCEFCIAGAGLNHQLGSPENIVRPIDAAVYIATALSPMPAPPPRCSYPARGPPVRFR